MTASTRSTRFWSLSAAATVIRPGSANVIARPWTVALLASAARSPVRRVHSCICRSASAMGAGTGASATTFHARSPLSTNSWRCSPRTGCTPPPRGGFSPCVRTMSSRSEAVS